MKMYVSREQWDLLNIGQKQVFNKVIFDDKTDYFNCLSLNHLFLFLGSDFYQLKLSQDRYHVLGKELREFEADDIIDALWKAVVDKLSN